MQVGNLLSGVALGWIVATFGLDDALTLHWSDNASVGTPPAPVMASMPAAEVKPFGTSRVAPSGPEHALDSARAASARPARSGRGRPARETPAVERSAASTASAGLAPVPSGELCPTLPEEDPREMNGEMEVVREQPWGQLTDDSWVSDLSLLTDPWKDD